MEDHGESLLYCDEDPLVSTPPPPTSPPATTTTATGSRGNALTQPVVAALDEQELDEILMEYKCRERSCAPRREYLEHLRRSCGVSNARSTGVQYIVYVFGRFGLAIATVFNAVNYLDRFLSMNCHVSWEVWMAELLSVACLSLACKLDEVNIPSLHDLQMEEVMRHSFRTSTVRDMELTLLKALQWRLACVTPFSFLDLLLTSSKMAPALASRSTNLLLHSLSDPSVLQFDASTVATSALRCVAQEHDALSLNSLIRPMCRSDDEECLKLMKAHCTSLEFNQNLSNQWSPISVISFQMEGTNTSKITRRLFGTEDKPKI